MLTMLTEYGSEEERLVAEQAVLVYRAGVQAMHTAPHGRGLATVEAVVMERGREHLRDILQRTLSAHSEAQKKGSAAGPAPVEAPAPSNTTRPRG